MEHNSTITPTPARLQELEDIAAVLRLPSGLRFMRRLLTLSGALAPSYAAGDPYATAYNEGLRRMGLVLLDETRSAIRARSIEADMLTRLLTQEETHVSRD